MPNIETPYRGSRLGPVFWGEITEPSQIYVGMEVAEVHRGNIIVTATVVTEPYTDSLGRLRINAASVKSAAVPGGYVVDHMSLADLSVVPYEGGMWNPLNRIIDITEAVGIPLEADTIDRTKLNPLGYVTNFDQQS